MEEKVIIVIITDLIKLTALANPGHYKYNNNNNNNNNNLIISIAPATLKYDRRRVTII